MWALLRDDTGLVCSDFSRYGRVSRVVFSAQKNTAELRFGLKRGLTTLNFSTFVARPPVRDVREGSKKVQKDRTDWWVRDTWRLEGCGQIIKPTRNMASQYRLSSASYRVEGKRHSMLRSTLSTYLVPLKKKRKRLKCSCVWALFFSLSLQHPQSLGKTYGGESPWYATCRLIGRGWQSECVTKITTKFDNGALHVYTNALWEEARENWCKRLDVSRLLVFPNVYRFVSVSSPNPGFLRIRRLRTFVISCLGVRGGGVQAGGLEEGHILQLIYEETCSHG